MFEGLWIGMWGSNVSDISVNYGVVVFRQGKIFGGNNLVYFVGDYDAEANQFHGNVQVTYFGREPLGIFGLLTIEQTEDLLIRGHISGDEIKVAGELKSNSKLRMYATLHRKAGEEIF